MVTMLNEISIDSLVHLGNTDIQLVNFCNILVIGNLSELDLQSLHFSEGSLP